MTPAVRFTAADVDRAHDAWGCNCGPVALAAICDMTLDEVRQHMGDFEAKRYTNPTLMFTALRSVGRPWRDLRRASATEQQWPRWGLCRIQWEGRWTQPGVPMRARYRYTHWIGATTRGDREVGVFDVNAIGNGSGWCALADWSGVLVPFLLEDYKGASGGWHITHSIEVQRP